MSGRTDLPISATGRKQVQQLAVHLAAREAFAVVYSSPLLRATATAAACPSCEPSVRLCGGLKELDCGAVDGLPIEQVRADYPQLWAKNLAQDDDEFRWPGGESYAELRLRCWQAITRIGIAHAGMRIAVVTHAGVISQIIGTLQGTRPAAWECFRPDNASITELAWDGQVWKLIRFNETPSVATQERHSAKVGVGPT